MKLTEEMIDRELIRGLQRNDVKLTKELLAKDLGDSLQFLIVSLALVKPVQKYKQEQEGFSAVVEFKSIAEAYKARQELMQQYAPEFLEDVSDCRDAFVFLLLTIFPAMRPTARSGAQVL